MNTIQNGITSLQSLFKVASFRIPQYQRAYSWQADPHLEAFLEDLRQQRETRLKSPEKLYYLGTVLLHAENVGGSQQIINIVDGQQRLTTSVIFIATALALHKEGKISLGEESIALLRRDFVLDEDARMQKLRTISEDEPFFRSSILGISSSPCQADTPSSRNLQLAKAFFTKKVDKDEWEGLVSTLKTSRLMVYAVDSAADATQIFELQNDRGKSLTSLESLKSFLMHSIYLHDKDGAADSLAEMQSQFAKIYRAAETLSQNRWAPDEDQILSYHCAAFLKWSDAEYTNPKRMIKSLLKGKDGQAAVGWIQGFIGELVISFAAVQALFNNIDQTPEFAEMLMLGRMGSFWPLIIKGRRLDDTQGQLNFRKMCRLLEVYTFRGYAIAGLRSDTGYSTLQTKARDFSGDYPALFKSLSELCFQHQLESRFRTSLDNPSFYEAEGRDACYLLWRYENSLRERVGQKQPPLTWRQYLEPGSQGEKFSVEHVAARENSVSDTTVEWDLGNPKPFHEIALHRLGNLVIDSISPNASKGNKDFCEKLKSLSENSIYLSQGELIEFASNGEGITWDVESVRRRQEHMVDFALKTWDPRTWHKVDGEA